MLFRQLFDNASATYTYLLASRKGAEALIIDPVYERVDRYLQLLEELDLKLVKAVDTHVHADHITGLGALRDRTRCITVMGVKSEVDVVSLRVEEGDSIDIEGLSLDVLYPPGHTDDSYSFCLTDRVFTGDTLLIRGTGRTDFQNGNSRAAYDSLFNKLLKLPDETLVYPGHDYKGETVSTIGEEKDFNPRLQVSSPEAYAALMDDLRLANPKMMDQAVPANLTIGTSQMSDEDATWWVKAEEALHNREQPDTLLVDLRDENEWQREGTIPQSLHAPYGELERFLQPGGLLHYEATNGGKRLMFYCAFGERSALAVRSAQEVGLFNVCHIVGGIDAWKKAGGEVES